MSLNNYLQLGFSLYRVRSFFFNDLKALFYRNFPKHQNVLQVLFIREVSTSNFPMKALLLR